jgi:hypothetical protein
MSGEAIWHVLIRTHGGTVSILKNLTEHAARETMQRLTPYWQRPVYRSEVIAMHQVRDSDVDQLEAFGPEGQTLTVWPTASSASSPGPQNVPCNPSSSDPTHA